MGGGKAHAARYAPRTTCPNSGKREARRRERAGLLASCGWKSPHDLVPGRFARSANSDRRVTEQRLGPPCPRRLGPVRLRVHRQRKPKSAIDRLPPSSIGATGAPCSSHFQVPCSQQARAFGQGLDV